jgi:predicted acyl esterase
MASGHSGGGAGTITNIEGALERTWAIYGPWEHMPPVDLGTCDTACAVDPLPGGVLLAWFDHWVMELKDVPIPEQPTFVSFESPRGASHGWRELSKWVPEGTSPVTYQLSAQGEIVETASTDAEITIHEPGDVTVMGAVATFTSAKLDKDRVLIGRATLDLRASLSAPDANFYVQLVDVDNADKETVVNDGFLKASHRNSHMKPEPVPVGDAIDYHIVVRPQHYRFASGHRVRVKLWGGNKDTLEQPAAVDVKLECGSKSKLTLPGFAGSAD